MSGSAHLGFRCSINRFPCAEKKKVIKGKVTPAVFTGKGDVG